MTNSAIGTAATPTAFVTHHVRRGGRRRAGGRSRRRSPGPSAGSAPARRSPFGRSRAITTSASIPDGPALVGELVEAVLVADVLAELADVGERADLDARHDRTELVEEVVALLPRVGDDHAFP